MYKNQNENYKLYILPSNQIFITLSIFFFLFQNVSIQCNNQLHNVYIQHFIISLLFFNINFTILPCEVPS